MLTLSMNFLARQHYSYEEKAVKTMLTKQSTAS